MESIDEYRRMFAAEYPAVVRTAYLVLYDYARSQKIAQDAFVQLLRHWEKVRRYEARRRPRRRSQCRSQDRLHAQHPQRLGR